jgi:predicted small lipoprotein YifL
MSEVDRLSNSGLYPVLPFGDKHQSKSGRDERPPSDKSGAPANALEQTKPDEPDRAQPDGGRNPKSLIDEYA